VLRSIGPPASAVNSRRPVRGAAQGGAAKHATRAPRHIGGHRERRPPLQTDLHPWADARKERVCKKHTRMETSTMRPPPFARNRRMRYNRSKSGGVGRRRMRVHGKGSAFPGLGRTARTQTRTAESLGHDDRRHRGSRDPCRCPTRFAVSRLVGSLRRTRRLVPDQAPGTLSPRPASVSPCSAALGRLQNQPRDNTRAAQAPSVRYW